MANTNQTIPQKLKDLSWNQISSQATEIARAHLVEGNPNGFDRATVMMKLFSGDRSGYIRANSFIRELLEKGVIESDGRGTFRIV